MSKKNKCSIFAESEMKRKIDFITNSSSSSFIVAWPKKVKTWEQVHEIVIFKEKADVVFDDCLKQKPFKIENTEKCLTKITEEIAAGYFYGHVSYFDYPEYRIIAAHDRKDLEDYNKKWQELSDKVDRINRKKAKVIAEKFISENIGKYCYIFSYADEDGYLGSQLEHGDTFRGLKHLQISHH
jgi:hypothetical protein